MQMPSRARAGTAHEARLAFRAGPARQTGPRAVLVHRAGHVGRSGPARLVIQANRAGPVPGRAGLGPLDNYRHDHGGALLPRPSKAKALAFQAKPRWVAPPRPARRVV